MKPLRFTVEEVLEILMEFVGYDDKYTGIEFKCRWILDEKSFPKGVKITERMNDSESRIPQ